MTYRKGESGNPKGRKPGMPTSSTVLRQQIADALPDIIASLVAAAKNGDTSAAKILVDRAIPAIKPQSAAITLPIGGNLSDTGINIINSTLNGEIPSEIGSQLITALAAQVKVIESCDLMTRIEALERAVNAANK